ncbi:MAG: molybdopterin dehydrogenase [Clostridia bacterium]|nr:molybdopterin dehydrogenase [Clostridia bacterium]
MVNGYVAQSLKEALDLRASMQVVPYAGGTDLMIKADDQVPYLFLHKVPEMKQVVTEDGYVKIGAACTFTELIAHEQTPDILKDALKKIAAPAIRNLGTIGGNLGNGSAKADSVLILFVTDAKVLLKSKDEQRLLSMQEFYQGRKQLALKDDELIVEIWIPDVSGCIYYHKKVGGRRALAISRVSFAGLIKIENQVITHLATSYGAVSDVVIRCPEIDDMLIGKTIDEAKACKGAYLDRFAEKIVPIRGRVSSEYRKSVCHNLLADFLSENGI